MTSTTVQAIVTALEEWQSLLSAKERNAWVEHQRDQHSLQQALLNIKKIREQSVAYSGYILMTQDRRQGRMILSRESDSGYSQGLSEPIHGFFATSMRASAPGHQLLLAEGTESEHPCCTVLVKLLRV